MTSDLMEKGRDNANKSTECIERIRGILMEIECSEVQSKDLEAIEQRLSDLLSQGDAGTISTEVSGGVSC